MVEELNLRDREKVNVFVKEYSKLLTKYLVEKIK